MIDNQKAIGKRLKQVRQSFDQTQEEFSKALLGATNKATISAYELGKMPIADKAKVVLYTTLNVNKEWLETGEGSMFVATDKVKLSPYEKGKMHDDDKDVRGLTDYLLAEKLKSMQDMIDEMRQWKKEIEDKLDEKEKKK